MTSIIKIFVNRVPCFIQAANDIRCENCDALRNSSISDFCANVYARHLLLSLLNCPCCHCGENIATYTLSFKQFSGPVQQAEAQKRHQQSNGMQAYPFILQTYSATHLPLKTEIRLDSSESDIIFAHPNNILSPFL